jgi:UDP-GlcNAc:undecaprenyl-phosphate GlcNAc-1-phosphate transferase
MGGSMSHVLAWALGAAVVAGLVTNLLVPPVARLATALRALDHPGSRKLQAGAVPRLGGIAIFGGLATAAGGAAVAQWSDWGSAIGRDELLALIFGTVLVLFVGILDDLVGVSTAKKFVLELLAAWLLVRVGWSFEVMRLPFVGEIHLGLFGGVVSLLWIVGVTNAINLLDGLDGLAGGVVAIIATSLLGYAALQGSPGSTLLMAATAGACIGFLRHNWEPAHIFMGDSGSLTLGFLLAAITVHSSIKAPATVAILVPILALGLPVMDTLLVMMVRFLDRPKGPLTGRFLGMFHADRKHLHHLLTHFGTGTRRAGVVAAIYGVVLAFCALALVVGVTGQNSLGVVLVGVEFCVILGMRQMGLALEARRLARDQRRDIAAAVLGLPAPPAPPVRLFKRRDMR